MSTAQNGFAMPDAAEEHELRNPIPRVYADFTGLHAREDAERLEKLAMLNERDRLNPPFSDTVEIGEAFEAVGGAMENITLTGSVGLTVYPDGNPKTLMGAKKPDPSVVPPIGVMHLATAMMNGAEKYGPFNWRDAAISTRPYIAAAMRHLSSYLDGEDFSADTIEAGLPVHHLGHVMACCAILLDAEAVGMLNDNRPTKPGTTGASIEAYVKTKRLSTTPTV